MKGFFAKKSALGLALVVLMGVGLAWAVQTQPETKDAPKAANGKRGGNEAVSLAGVEDVVQFNIAEHAAGDDDLHFRAKDFVDLLLQVACPRPIPFCSHVIQMEPPPMPTFIKSAPASATTQIGRASCRERV